MVPPRLRRRVLALFLAPSCLDLLLTLALLGQPGGVGGEGNPVAGWCLGRFGWPGVAALKLASVLLALALLAVAARRNPQAAGRGLALGCAVLWCVVLYSILLLAWSVTPAAQADVEALARARQKSRHLEREFALRKVRQEVLDRLAGDLRAGRRSLGEAVGALRRSGVAGDPGRTDDGRLAELLRGLAQAEGDGGRRFAADGTSPRPARSRPAFPPHRRALLTHAAYPLTDGHCQ